jgi:hypothetical protein
MIKPDGTSTTGPDSPSSEATVTRERRVAVAVTRREASSLRARTPSAEAEARCAKETTATTEEEEGRRIVK